MILKFLDFLNYGYKFVANTIKNYIESSCQGVFHFRPACRQARFSHVDKLERFMYKNRMTMSLAKNLRTERKRLGLSAEELAELVGVSRSYITLLESGKRSPSKTIVAKIAKGLRVKSWVVEEWFLEDQLKKLGIKDKKILYKLRLIIIPFLKGKKR